jgi:hypothetical protein
MKKKLFSYLVLMLLLTVFLPVSTNAINLDNNFNKFLKTPPPIPGDMSFPYPEFNTIDASSKKVISPLIHSQSANFNIIDMIDAMDESLILSYLQNLTDFGPRVTGTTACHDAGEYIYDEFVSMGLDVRFHNWSNGGYTDRNVEATLHGINESSDEIFIVCAHYDSVPGSPGADDDGSGTVVTLASAFIMKEYAFNYTIRFVTFSGEEQGLLGSEVYAEEAYANGDDIIGVLNVDMIGFAITKEHGENVKIYYNGASEWLVDYTEDVSNQYDEYINLNIVPSGFSWGSDHYSFWEVGYDAIFYHEYEFNQYYHSPEDIIENMNLTYDAKCSKLIIATLAELAEQYRNSNPPYPPSINGPTDGRSWEEYEFTFTTTDPDNDDVYYYVDWGDDTNSGWMGPYQSGEEATIKNKWTSAGQYGIKARARDTNYVASDWSDPFSVNILEGPKLDIQLIKGGLFKISTTVKNIGGFDATDVNWRIFLDGGAIIGKVTTGIVNILEAEEIKLKSKFILGFGPTRVTVEAWIDDGPSDILESHGFVLLCFIYI